MLTSIFVHGITIPIGKGFQKAVTINSKSQSQLNGIVSRLPEPVSLPIRKIAGVDGNQDDDENNQRQGREDGEEGNGEGSSGSSTHGGNSPPLNGEQEKERRENNDKKGKNIFKGSRGNTPKHSRNSSLEELSSAGGVRFADNTSTHPSHLSHGSQSGILGNGSGGLFATRPSRLKSSKSQEHGDDTSPFSSCGGGGGAAAGEEPGIKEHQDEERQLEINREKEHQNENREDSDLKEGENVWYEGKHVVTERDGRIVDVRLRTEEEMNKS